MPLVSASAPPPDITVVVVPREKYGCAERLLHRLLSMDGPPFRLVWVDDSRAPTRLRRAVRAAAATRGVIHLSLSGRVGANRCRVEGLQCVGTPYAFLMDNDADFATDDALTTLLDCIETSGGSFAAPVYMNSDGTVHHAGGTTCLTSDATGRHLVEKHVMGGLPSVTLAGIERSPVGCLEMHGVLVRMSSLAAAGVPDPELIGGLDCADLSLRLQPVDGGGWLEPRAAVVYDNALPGAADLALHLERWSRATVEHDIARFAATWGVDPHDRGLDAHRHFLAERRYRPFHLPRRVVRRLLPRSAQLLLDRSIDWASDRFATV